MAALDHGAAKTRGHLAAVAALSAAMLALEIALTRLLALTQFHHFAFLVVSLALLGLAAAGSALTVRPGLGRQLGRLSALFSLACIAILLLYDRVPFDSYAIAWDRRQVPNLVAMLAVTALPFFLVGLVVGALLAAGTDRAHRVYAANLIGSAVGSLASLLALSRIGAEPTVLLCAAVGLAAAAALSGETGQAASRLAAARPVAAIVVALLLAAAAVTGPGIASVRLSPYKALSQALLAPDARHTVSLWDAHGRIDVVESGAIHVMPGLGQHARIARPPLQAGLMVDGDDLAPITALAPTDEAAVEIARNVPESVAHALRPAGAWLVLEPGGGWPVLTALAGGARTVTAVDRSEAAVRTVRGAYGAWAHGLYDDPRVAVAVAEPRVALHRTTSRYDVVLLALRDGYRPVTSGAYSLGEDYGTTVEALEEALAAAGPDGIVVATRWLQRPPTESVRMLANLHRAVARGGSSRPGAHIAAFRTMRTMTFVVANRALQPRERQAVRDFVETRGFDIVWLPDVRTEEVNRHQRLPTPIYAEAFAGFLRDPDGFVAANDFDIRPTTDDRPFFHHFFRWRQTPDVLAGLGKSWQPFGGSGYFVLVSLLLATSGLAVVLVIVPLASKSTSRRELRETLSSRRAALVYFAALGSGYMFILIPLSQRAILYLGNAPQALAVVSAALLLSSGLGSMTAPRWRPEVALALAAIGALVLPAAVERLWDATLAWSDGARLAVCVLTIAPIGFPIGVPFPAGLRQLERRHAGATAWAWAVNGSASVVSGIVAVMLALTWGFAAVVWCAAATYVVAIWAVRRHAAAAPRPRAAGA